MARRRAKGLPIHGWLAIDKAAGMTSTQVVARVKHLTQAQKAGHGGTLDPLATGVLPLALGEATKTVAELKAEPGNDLAIPVLLAAWFLLSRIFISVLRVAPTPSAAPLQEVKA